MLKGLISQAREYFEDTIKVERSRWIQLTPHCGGRYYKLQGSGIMCEGECLPTCGPATVPPNSKIFTECKCENKKCKTDWSKYQGKLKHTDFVMMAVIRDDGHCDEETLAYAAACNLHSVTKRPISGFVNVCPQSFDKIQKNEMTQWLSTIKHELIHAFVFSTSHYPRFIGAKDPTQQSPIPIIPGVIEKFIRTDWEVAKGQIKRDVYMIVTPRVREEARKYFNCPTLEGAEIENQGGPGTAGSHWEKRVLENEAMSGVATQVYAVSRITLALFEDSGWYQVNYDKAENMTWGKGLGCDFVKKSCLSWMLREEGPYPFCTLMGSMTCNANRKSKVLCNFVQGDDIPEEYDYNRKGVYTDRRGDEVHGLGSEMTADYCPYYRVFGEISVEARDTRCTYPGNMNYNNYSMEIFSKTARCFELDGGIKVKRHITTITYSHWAGCYEAMCKDGRVHIKVQNSKFYPCYFAGQYIYLEKYVLRVGYVETKIICPPCTDLCHECAPEEYTKQKIGDFRNLSTTFLTIMCVAAMLLHFI